MGQPAARVGDMHVCPMFDGPKPHVGGPVLPPGKPTVLIGGMPAATITDRCACASVPDIIMQGSQTVLINGMMAARMGDATVHGGRIIIGCPTVLIGGPTFTDTSLLRFKPIEDEEPSILSRLTSIGLDFTPGVGTLKGLIEGITGHDSVTGEKLTTVERLIGWVPILGKAGRAVKGGKNIIKGVAKAREIKKVSEIAKLNRIAKAAQAGLTPKITKQIPKRGWTETTVRDTIKQPVATSEAVNRATGNRATAFFNSDGSYVVVDDATNEVVQVSNRLDPNWVPDATIKNPYTP